MAEILSLDRFRVVGGTSLRGDVTIQGAKNSVLKLMAVTLLAPGKSTIHNVPDIADVAMMADLLERLGCTITRDIRNQSISIDVPDNPGHRAEYELVRKLRASINVLGPLVARMKRAEVALPGYLGSNKKIEIQYQFFFFLNLLTHLLNKY